MLISFYVSACVTGLKGPFGSAFYAPYVSFYMPYVGAFYMSFLVVFLVVFLDVSLLETSFNISIIFSSNLL